MCGTGTCEILVDSLRTSQRVKYINGDCVPSSSGYVAGRGNQEPDCVPSPSGSVAGRGNQEPDCGPSSSGSVAEGGNQKSWFPYKTFESKFVSLFSSSINSASEKILNTKYETVKDDISDVLKSYADRTHQGLEKVYTDSVGMISSTKETYIDPLLVTADNINPDTLFPVYTKAEELLLTLRSKAVSKAYEVFENPGLVYKECVVSGKNSVVKAKDATVICAVTAAVNAKELLITTVDISINQLLLFFDELGISALKVSVKSMHLVLNFGLRRSSFILLKSVDFILEAHGFRTLSQISQVVDDVQGLVSQYTPNFNMFKLVLDYNSLLPLLKQAEKEDNAYMVLVLTQMEKTLRTLFRTNFKSLEFGNLSKLDVKISLRIREKLLSVWIGSEIILEDVFCYFVRASVCEIFLKLAVVLINADENMRGNPIIKSLETESENTTDSLLPSLSFRSKAVPLSSMATCVENHSNEITLKMADTSLAEELAAAETSLAEELATAEEHATAEDDQVFRCFTKALELPMVSVLTSTVTATTELISKTRPVQMVTEKIRTVGEREEVKSVLSSVNCIYENNLSSRVETVKTNLTPTLKTLDDYACHGMDRVNDKVTETKDYYVTPAVTVVTDLKDSTLEMYGTCVHKVAETKTAYVDPVVHKVYDIKDSTTKAYSECERMVYSAKENYVNPMLEKASDVKTTYVTPTIKMVDEVRTGYVVPAINKAYEAVDNPGQVYNECVEYGKEAITHTKDATINTAIATIDSAKGYLVTARDTAVNKLSLYIEDTKTTVKRTSSKTLDISLTYAKQARSRFLIKSSDLLLEAQEALYAGLMERFPKSADLLDRSFKTVTYASRVLFLKTTEAASVMFETTRKVNDVVGKRLEQSREVYRTSRTFIVSATETSLNYGRQFRKSNEDNIRYIASVAGCSAYLGLIGLELNKEKTL